MKSSTTQAHSAVDPRPSLLALAEALYTRISSGHDGLAYAVDRRGPALTVLEDGRRRVVQLAGDPRVAPPWRRAKELRDGVEVDRRFNPYVLMQHVRGRYSVAPCAGGWTGWLALDIDAHPAPGEPELAARRLAKARADRVLAAVWRALGFTRERRPIVERTPGGGYRLWLPLTRGEGNANGEHTWPTLIARARLVEALRAANLEIAPGVLEVYPSGRGLRAPCGPGSLLLRPTSDDPDALGLEPVPGTFATRIDWRGDRPDLTSVSRRVEPLVRAFLDEWDAQRRTLADWLGQPGHAWDVVHGPLVFRDDDAGDEKNQTSEREAEDTPSQESDEVSGRRGARVRGGRSAGAGERGAGGGDLSLSEIDQSPAALEADSPPSIGGDDGVCVRGREFKEKVYRLLDEGVTEPGTRHDAVLTLAFYWAATCGLDPSAALERLHAWCLAHTHQGSRLGSRPRAFLTECMREAGHYIEHHSARWKFRGQGDGGGLATLTVADEVVLAAVDPRVRDEVRTVLAWLAGRAGSDGVVGEPVQIATGLLARLCGDRRVLDGKRRRRATTIAIVELARLGVLTMTSNYIVGRNGRRWSCWYRFGSGVLPACEAMPADRWRELAAYSAADTSPDAAETRQEPASGVSAPIVEVRVLAVRRVPEGLLRALSDGSRAPARPALELDAEVCSPTATPSARPPWFVRDYLIRPFTVAELLSADPLTFLPIQFDIEARRRLSRRQRLRLGGGDARA
ncbi:MAG TPA: hypothetical protein VGM90_16410 [Kofleriaceae bacterium]|jgi:hypothetical protein